MFCVTGHSSTKSSVRESGKAKLGAAEKVATTVATAARADKGKGTPDHHGTLLKLYMDISLHASDTYFKNAKHNAKFINDLLYLI